MLKSDNCVLALRKRLFCDAKPTLLPCKTAAFGTQNNRFYKALIIRQLNRTIRLKISLQFYRFISNYKTENKTDGKTPRKIKRAP
ncbi:hypothetical protein CTM62_08135 [Prevotella intermedia]|uniref:Uncharacterized protein n=1 Tax=Prevotella intermedia TaxID=28131 RepID=A0A2D3L801_PREIN|nr:hypothetical protein CTM62_08135 [Prevotella intermedia]